MQFVGATTGEGEGSSIRGAHALITQDRQTCSSAAAAAVAVRESSSSSSSGSRSSPISTSRVNTEPLRCTLLLLTYEHWLHCSSILPQQYTTTLRCTLLLLTYEHWLQCSSILPQQYTTTAAAAAAEHTQHS
eukprot:10386-Heterococcus_DN1.PRE.3